MKHADNANEIAIESDNRINKSVSVDGKILTFNQEAAIAALKNIRASDTDSIKGNNNHKKIRSTPIVGSMIASGRQE